jgi:hypothetical protein
LLAADPGVAVLVVAAGQECPLRAAGVAYERGAVVFAPDLVGDAHEGCAPRPVCVVDAALTVRAAFYAGRGAVAVAGLDAALHAADRVGGAHER